MAEDGAMSSNSDSSSDDERIVVDDERQMVTEEQLNQLKQQVLSNPFNYSAHIALIAALRQAGELIEVREARESFAERFPLSPQLWLEWIRDEIRLQESADDSEEAKSRVLALFERAVVDYVSLDVWLEYCQWACGGVDGFDRVREVFERAITAVGLQCDRAALLWDAYRVFEAALCQLYAADTNGADYVAQRTRVEKLYRRQFRIPIMQMDRTWKEYQDDFMDGAPVDPLLKSVYESSLKRLAKLQQFEDFLDLAPEPADQEYQGYIKFEVEAKDPARIQLIFERALVKNCLKPTLWVQYLTWLDDELKVSQVSLGVYARAVRNCPWSGEIWKRYLIALERADTTPSSNWPKVQSVFEQTKENFSNSTEAAELWLHYLFMVKRHCDRENTDLSKVQKMFVSASEELISVFGQYDWDPEGTFRRLWAHFEAYKCGDIEKAVNSASDCRERVCTALLQFEREEGTIDQLLLAQKRVRAQLDRQSSSTHKHVVQQPKQQQRHKGQPAQHVSPSKSTSRKHQLPREDNQTSFRPPMDKQKRERQTTSTTEIANGAPKAKQARLDQSGTRQQAVTDAAEVESMTEKQMDHEGFAVPALPTKGVKPAPQTVPTEQASTSDQPNTGADTAIERTVFVSNLDFALEEQVLRDIFSQVGTISEIRLARKYGRLSKGYGYVEFTDSAPIEAALALDRHKIDARPMYVSRCEPRRIGHKKKSEEEELLPKVAPAGFRFSQRMEKNKLFVKNIHLSTTDAQLEELFRPYGELRAARLVLHKSGKSKGIAYVEFADEASAKRALIATDNTVFDGRTLSVAISDPPQRKQTPVAYPPTLGGGSSKGDGEQRKAASSKLQMSAMTPRVVATAVHPGTIGKFDGKANTKKPIQTASDNASAKQSISLADSVSGTSEKAKLSNEQFRNMFLKKD